MAKSGRVISIMIDDEVIHSSIVDGVVIENYFNNLHLMTDSFVRNIEDRSSEVVSLTISDGEVKIKKTIEIKL